MGRASRLNHASGRLAAKLKAIRTALKLTQRELVTKLGNFPTIDQSIISGFESGRREPPSLVLLAYARLANLYVDALLDDEVELPKKLPPKKRSAGIKTEKKTGASKN